MNIVTWDPSLRYQAFYNPELGEAELACGVVEDSSGMTMQGLTVDRRFLLVCKEGLLRNFELREGHQAPDPALGLEPLRPQRVDEPIQTRIDGKVKIRWNRLEDRLRIQIGEGDPERWQQLGDCPLWLGLGPDELLMAVLCQLVMDSDGSHQRSWRESLAAG